MNDSLLPYNVNQLSEFLLNVVCLLARQNIIFSLWRVMAGMKITEDKKERSSFHTLVPDMVLRLVEESLDRHCTNLFRPLNSYINRVFELEAEDGGGLIVKFYRPGRWSKDALQDEHDFLLELHEYEIPVIKPLVLKSGDTLGQFKDIFFAVFPKCGGRTFDEFSDEQWFELGRLLGRFHNVGEQKQLKDRIILTPELSTRKQVNYLLENDIVPTHFLKLFQELVEALLTEIEPLFSGQEMIPIHGDCHFSNIIYRPGESFYLIDFDDMATGPPVQDFWMLLPDYMENSLVEIDMFIEGYESFRNFDRKSIRLIEPLRSMRYIHYMAWLAYQVLMDGNTQISNDFGTDHYWQSEMKDLNDQLERIRGLDSHFGNYY